MGLVIVTGTGLEHCYVANLLSESHETDAILVCEPPPRRSWRKVLAKSPIRFLDKAARQVYLRIIQDAAARKSSLRRVLGPGSANFARPDLVQYVGPPKAAELATTVARLRPSVLAVYGTGIIPDAVLGSAKKVALNMHTGLSPEYRGVACAFWPIYDGRPDMVGATVHECTSDIDGGLIYFRQVARLQRQDDLHAIFARAVVTGAAGYVKVVGDALAGELNGAPQDLENGREFRGDQLGLRSELETRRILQRLRRTNRLG